MLPSRFIFDDWFDEPKMDGRMKVISMKKMETLS